MHAGKALIARLVDLLRGSTISETISGHRMGTLDLLLPPTFFTNRKSLGLWKRSAGLCD